ncbi:hypothetical protein AMJ44_03065 [candidate division WOR-1 bacterium DG_54_3]|uniref:Uncharacterized protein n=1 Tax=candidate division WOR-1 bacterium DG_54_3 TaxID=1703775 RepID=A0A0S7Y4H4_UNCSA|nr:MAG: hypothetical protein AMJ44_03065 [candidate division WOR-1 bacterium DG_54_3]
MYLPTRSASLLDVALTLLWTLKPVCRQRRIFSTRGSPMSFFPKKQGEDLIGEESLDALIMEARDLM